MCSTSNISYQYQTSDFVAVVKIIKNYKNNSAENQHYIADIEILNLYKGKPKKQLYILGNSREEGYNSCGTFINEGETRLIFGNIISKDKVSTDLCSSYHKPNRDYYKRDFIEDKLDVLARYAKEHKIKIINDAYIAVYNFKKLERPSGNKHFSIVSVKISSKGEIQKIKYLTKDKKIVEKPFEAYINSTFKDKLLQRIRKDNHGKFTIFFEFNPYKS